MNRFLVLLALMGLLLAPVTGCKTAPKDPQAIVHITMRDTWAGVKAAMRVYADACARGKVSLEKQAEIDNAYEKFRQPFLMTIRLARLDWTMVTPTDIDALAQEVINLVLQLNL